MQQEAQIEDMMRRGVPLGAVAAALASPETAERIAVLEAATAGHMSALDAARLNMCRAGHDSSLVERLHRLHGMTRQLSLQPRDDATDATNEGETAAGEKTREEAVAGASPLSQVSQLSRPLPLAREVAASGMNGHMNGRS
jgi:hypothetical protein